MSRSKNSSKASYCEADFFFQDVGRNVCHGSDAVESAKKEIALWFSKEEILNYTQAQYGWIYEK